MSLVVTPRQNLVSFEAVGPTNLGGEINASGCTSLESLTVENQDITLLNITNCDSLKFLTFNNNLLTSFNFNATLENVNLNNNQLTQIKAANRNNLKYLFANSNNIGTAEVTNCTSLQSLNLNDNNVSILDVSTCTSLETLNIENNQLGGNLTGLGSMSTSLLGSKLISIKNNNMTAQNLNVVFNQLPTKSGSSIFEWSINIHDNLGVCTCDWTIAKNKGWLVYPELYTLTSSVDSVDEGVSVTFTLNASKNTGNVAYTISGITSNDIGGASLTGSFVLVNGSASATFNITNDVLTEGTETMTLSLNGVTCPTSKSVIINDTSLSPTPTPTATVTNTPTPTPTVTNTPTPTPTPTVTNTPTPTATPKPTPTPTSTPVPTPSPTPLPTPNPTPTATPAPTNFNETLSINSPLALSDDGTLMSLTPQSTYIAETTSSNYIRRNIMLETVTLVDGPIDNKFKNNDLTNYNDGYGYYFWGTVSGGGSTTYSIVLDFIEQTNLTSYVSYIQITNEDTGVVLKKYVCFPQDDQYNWHNVLQLNTWVEAVLDGSGNETYDEETGTILITQPITTPFVFTVPTVTDTSILPNLYEHKVKTIVPTYPAPGSLLTAIQNFENLADNKYSFIGKTTYLSGASNLVAARKYAAYIYHSTDQGVTWSIRGITDGTTNTGKTAGIIGEYVFNEAGILRVQTASYSKVNIKRYTNGYGGSSVTETNSYKWIYITKANGSSTSQYLGFYLDGTIVRMMLIVYNSPSTILEIASLNAQTLLFNNPNNLTYVDGSGLTYNPAQNKLINDIRNDPNGTGADVTEPYSLCFDGVAEGYTKRGNITRLATTRCTESQKMKVHQWIIGSTIYTEHIKNFEILQNVGSGRGSILYDSNNKTFILLPKNENKIMYIKDAATLDWSEVYHFRARVESQLPASKNWVDHAV